MKKNQKLKLYILEAGEQVTEMAQVSGFDSGTVTVMWTSNASGKQESDKFCRKTGKCLNGNTSIKSQRYIDPQ
jgi:hypothetical protein